MKGRLIAGILVMALGLAGCGASESAEEATTPTATAAGTVEMSTAAEDITTTMNTTAQSTTPATSSEKENAILEEESDYIRNFVDRYIYPDYNDSVALFDIDDDGVDEVLRVLMDGSTAHELSFTVYEVTGNEMKETFVFTCLEEENLYFENSLIGNKLCKYYDKEKDQFFWLYNILSIWDGNITVSYRIIKFSFDEDKISAEFLSETFGEWCFSADEPWVGSPSKWQERGRYIFLFGNSVLENQSTPIGFFDSHSKDKFNNDFEDYISQYELVETIELDSLTRYYDKNEIYEKIKYIDITNNIVADDFNYTTNSTTWRFEEILITNIEDYNKIADNSHSYIVVTPENSNSDYFEFLYDDTEIECIRFVDCTDEQINEVLTNMPSLKCYLYGYSEV